MWQMSIGISFGIQQSYVAIEYFSQGRRHRGDSCAPWENFGGAVPSLKFASLKCFFKHLFSMWLEIKRLVKILSTDKTHFVYTALQLSWQKWNTSAALCGDLHDNFAIIIDKWENFSVSFAVLTVVPNIYVLKLSTYRLLPKIINHWTISDFLFIRKKCKNHRQIRWKKALPSQ